MSFLRAGLLILAACGVLACSSSGEPRPAAPPTVTQVRGSCANAGVLDAEGRAHPGARPTGPLTEYRLSLRVQPGPVRVRANAMWPAGDHRNVIGTLEGRTVVRATGPLHDAEVSSGIGYAIAVEDSAGARCRGYLSGTVVDSNLPEG